MALLLASAISLYLFLPSLAEVFSAWDKLGEVHPAWLAVVLVCESLSFVSVWRLQLIVLRTHRWTPIALSQLVGNAFNRITPGGGATGTAFQVRMLTTAGIEPSVSGPALTAQSLLISAVIVVLLLVSVPALLLAGATVPSGITEAALLGLPVFVVLAALATALLVTERPLCWIGERIDRFRSRHGRVDGEPLGEKLVRERNLVRHVLGERWWDALGCAIARWAFEYFALVIVLHAISANPSPALGVPRVPRGVCAQHDPDHTGWNRVRRGRAHGRAGGGGRGAGAGPSRHARVPARLLLATAPHRARRLGLLPEALPSYLKNRRREALRRLRRDALPRLPPGVRGRASGRAAIASGVRAPR